jgi:hypothetical protein
MVPVVDGDDVIRVVRALGVDYIATLAAADVTQDIMTRIPQTEGLWKNWRDRPGMWRW